MKQNKTSALNRISSKMRSDTGASITFGLLLFLVCAVISSIVIVAGTTAAGRLSDMAKSEQRYYSVQSTAKLVQELLEDGSATIIKIGDKNYLVSGNDLKPVSEGTATVNSLPDYVACKLCQLNGSGGTFDLTLDQKSLSDKANDVDIKAKVGTDDHITFTVKSDDYSIPVNFSTSKKSMPVDISGDDAGTGTKTVYNWDISGSGSQESE